MICLPKPGFPQPALNVENEIVVRLLQEHLSSPIGRDHRVKVDDGDDVQVPRSLNTVKQIIPCWIPPA